MTAAGAGSSHSHTFWTISMQVFTGAPQAGRHSKARASSSKPLEQAETLNTMDLGNDTLVFIGKTPWSSSLGLQWLPFGVRFLTERGLWKMSQCHALSNNCYVHSLQLTNILRDCMYDKTKTKTRAADNLCIRNLYIFTYIITES